MRCEGGATDTEEDFNTAGGFPAGALVNTAATIVEELSDRDFVAKFAAGEGKDEPDFTARVHKLTAELEFLAQMLARTFPEI